MGLRETDGVIMEHQHKWLNDRLINAAQAMLKEQCGIPGLQDIMLSQTLSMNIMAGEFVQILNKGNYDWFTISSIGCEPGVVKVFDSRKAP